MLDLEELERAMEVVAGGGKEIDHAAVVELNAVLRAVTEEET